MTKIVKSVQKIETKPVFDITVQDDHHYILSNGLVSHNSGLKYAASTIIYLSKKKHKDGDGEVIGNIIHCKTYKSRLTKENRVIDVLLNFDSGLDRYYGLVDLGIKHGILKKVANKVQFPDGKSDFESKINKDPAKWFTEDVLKVLEDAAAKEFKYGQDEEAQNAE